MEIKSFRATSSNAINLKLTSLIESGVIPQHIWITGSNDYDSIYWVEGLFEKSGVMDFSDFRNLSKVHIKDHPNKDNPEIMKGVIEGIIWASEKFLPIHYSEELVSHHINLLSELDPFGASAPELGI